MRSRPSAVSRRVNLQVAAVEVGSLVHQSSRPCMAFGIDSQLSNGYRANLCFCVPVSLLAFTVFASCGNEVMNWRIMVFACLRHYEKRPSE